MSILTRWLLIPPVNARLIGRYRDYRRHGASAFSATLGCFWMILAWIFIPLEHPHDDPVSLVCGLILLFAETYAWIVLVLGYFQVVWPLNRQPVPLPKDMSLWPSVDIFVPTYNEDLNVVKNTIYASLGIDWPSRILL